jgi:hypothetical protein
MRCFLCGPLRVYVTGAPSTSRNVTLTFSQLLRQMTDPSTRQRGRPISTIPHLSDSNKYVYLVLDPRWGVKPRLTGRLTVGRNVTLTWSQSEEGGPGRRLGSHGQSSGVLES